MHKLFLLAGLITLFVAFVLNVQHVTAVSQNVVISQIKAGNSASSRLVELYNNSSFAVDVTNWCVYYTPPSDSSRTNVGCFVDTDPKLHIFLPGHSFALLASTQTGISADIVLNLGLGTGSGGHVYLINHDNEVDRVGWQSGSLIATNPEGHAVTITDTKVIERQFVVGSTNTFIDTDNNATDFIASTLRTSYKYGSLFDVIDVCNNIEGIQEFVPDGFTLVDDGSCSQPPIDVCTNIDEIQTDVPSGYELGIDGLCQIDICNNLSDIQSAVPDGYTVDNLGFCLPVLLPIRVNEVLPNAIGSDEGNEFIELYNPNNTTVDLSSYILKVGIDTPKEYVFPGASYIEPNSYKVFYNADIGFTLVNTSGQVAIMSTNDQIVDSSPIYLNPAEGLAWALIGDVWQYTNQPTPGLENVTSAVTQDNVEPVVAELKPCASNQFRSPETNRCRLLVTTGSTIVACKDGQYRSEITNRCRSIAGDAGVVMPCAANQYRNTDTNRCKLIESASSTLTPCTENQERNVDTNRCRNVVSTIPNAGFAVEPIPDSSSSTIGWFAVGGVCLIALGYGVWEWRQEFTNGIRKFGSFFHWHK